MNGFVERYEDAENIPRERRRMIVSKLGSIESWSFFLKDGRLKLDVVGYVKRSCFIPEIKDSDTHKRMRKLIAIATYMVGESMTLGDAVCYYCNDLPGRDKSIVYSMMRPLYIQATIEHTPYHPPVCNEMFHCIL